MDVPGRGSVCHHTAHGEEHYTTSYVVLSPCPNCGSRHGACVTADLVISRSGGIDRRNNVYYECEECGVSR